MQVDRRVAAIKPGATLKEFTSNGIAHALEFWDPAAGGLRETVFLVSAREGNALMSDSLVCQFDREDRLVGCQQACCRRESRTISLEQYNSLRIGEPRSAIEHRLCSPSNGDSLGVPGLEPEGPHGVKTYYHIPLPVDHHDEGQTVMLVFDDNRLSFKEMSPYY